MEATGAASIRMMRIIEQVGVANGSIAYHFGSREGLVQEAIAERYLSAVSRGLEIFTARAGDIESREQLVDFFRSELRRLGGSSFHELRVRRLSALGAALLRPGVRERIIAEQAAGPLLGGGADRGGGSGSGSSAPAEAEGVLLVLLGAAELRVPAAVTPRGEVDALPRVLELQLPGASTLHAALEADAALLRPGVRERIIAEQAASFDRASRPIERLQTMGIIDPTLDARAFAAWFLGLLLSRILSDLDPGCDPDEEWSEFTLASILANLMPTGAR